MRNKKKTIYFVGGSILLAFIGLQYFFGILTTKAEVASLDRLTTLGDAVQSGNADSQQPSFSGDSSIITFISSSTDLVSGDTNGVDDAFVSNKTTGSITRVSVASDGTQGDDVVWRTRISGNARFVVFESNATNLVSGDVNGAADIFVHDLQTSTTEIVSLTHDGSISPDGGGHPQISTDGRYVTFSSSAALVPEDTNNEYDGYIYDRELETTELATLGDDESIGNSYVGYMDITPDGRYVIFSSNATNLVAGDTNGVSDVFIRDRQLGTTELVSLSDDEVLGNGNISVGVDLSSDARYVVFASNATNLVAGDTNGVVDVFIRDRQLGTTERLSVTQTGTEDTGDSFWPKMSDDGRYVAFETVSDFVPEDTNGVKDIYYRDLQGGTIQRVSVATDGSQSTAASDNYGSNILSSDGRYVAFQTLGAFVASDINNNSDIYIRDLDLGTSERLFEFENSIEQINGSPANISVARDNNLIVFDTEATNLDDDDTLNTDVYLLNRSLGTFEWLSVASNGGQSDENSFNPKIATNGRYVVFESNATNLVPGDTNDATDIFVRDLETDTTERISVSTIGGDADGISEGAHISSDGRYVVFLSAATNLVAGDTNGERDVFVRDLITDTTERANVSSAEQETGLASYEADISGDGRYVVFSSAATNLVSGDDAGVTDIFLRDRQLGTTIAITHRTVTTHGNGSSSLPMFSSDGTVMVFESTATDLVSGDTNDQNDIFVLNRSTGEVERVSVATGGVEADAVSTTPAISPDGRYVVFLSAATNLVAGDTNGYDDIFLRDLQLDTTERISLTDDESQSNEHSAIATNAPVVSSDGRYVVFSSAATNLVTGDSNLAGDIFIRDRQLGSTTRVSLTDDESQSDGWSVQPALSSDGTKVVFLSTATNLVVGDTNVVPDIFVRDISLGTTERVNLSSIGAETSGSITGSTILISSNGRYVFFLSDASTLVSGDTNAASDLFVRDLVADTTERVSVSDTEQEADTGVESSGFAISSDGRKVAFSSAATNLVIGDTNDIPDVFIRNLDLGTTEIVSVTYDESNPDGQISNGVAFSGDGGLVSFVSAATNFVGEDFNDSDTDIYIRNLETSTTTFAIDLPSTSLQANSGSTFPVISEDGTMVAFSSDASNLVAGDAAVRQDVFTYSVSEGTLSRISYGMSAEANGNSERSSISSDGTKIVFYSYATNLVAGDTNTTSDIFLYDADNDSTIRLTQSMAAVQSNAVDDADQGYGFAISPDGVYAAFVSSATNLVSAVDNNFASDLFWAKVGGTTVSSSGTSSVRTRSGSVPTRDQIQTTPIDTPLSPVVSCTTQYFDEYLHRGMVGLRVVKMQRFLSDRGFYRGPVNGFFGPKTELGVKKFQAQYTKEVLLPWNLTDPTGVWGRTTRAMANKFEGCSEGPVTLPNGTVVTF